MYIAILATMITFAMATPTGATTTAQGAYLTRASVGWAMSPLIAQSKSTEWGASEEAQFVDKINALRASLGLATLEVDGELTTQARIWSETMRQQGDIFHSKNLSDGISADWQKLGENVGVGPSVDSLFDAFVASPKHYENLVDPSYRFIGVGVVWNGSVMYTAHRFMAVFPPQAPAPAQSVSPSPPPTTPTTPPTTVPASTPPPVELPAAEAPPTANVPQPRPTPADPERVALILKALDGVDDL